MFFRLGGMALRAGDAFVVDFGVLRAFPIAVQERFIVVPASRTFAEHRPGQTLWTTMASQAWACFVNPWSSSCSCTRLVWHMSGLP